MRVVRTSVLAAALVAGLSAPAFASAIVLSAAGLNPADIQAQVDAFRLALGPLNPNVAGSFPTGRREINWDGVPDAFAAPNSLPANFFNANSPRGVVLSTPGTGFQVSADAVNVGATPIEFGNIDPNYPTFFRPFSSERLFTALGSTITDVSFFVPGSSTPGFTSAFGAVFSDVDAASTTSLEFFDSLNNWMGTFFLPNIAGNETFSFLGLRFDGGERIGRVRLTSGNQVLSPGNIFSDLVVMDDFIYAEPQEVPVPEPATGLLTLLGLGVMKAAKARRRRLGSAKE